MLAVLTLSPAAYAQPPACADADAEESRAQRLREDGRDLEAVRVLELVVRCERLPRRVARLGLAEAAAGLWVPSEAHLAEALATSDPWVRRVRRDLAAQLTRVREHVGNLEVLVNAPAGELRIGGARAASLPMSEPLRVPSGALTYEILAPGFVREVRRVDISPGRERLTRENVLLTPEVAPAPPVSARPAEPTAAPPPPRPVLAEVAPPAPPPQAPVPAPPPSPARSGGGGWMRPTAIAATVVGGAAVVAGVVAVVLGSSAAAHYNDDSRCLVEGGGTRDEQCGAQRSTAQSMQALAFGGFIGGAALLGAAVGLFVAAPSARRAPPVTLGAGPGELGIALRGSF